MATVYPMSVHSIEVKASNADSGRGWGRVRVPKAGGEIKTLDNSDPVSMIRKQRGMISVVSRNSIVGGESDLTSAPMTPREVRRRYSNGRDFDVVFRKG